MFPPLTNAIHWQSDFVATLDDVLTTSVCYLWWLPIISCSMRWEPSALEKWRVLLALKLLQFDKKPMEYASSIPWAVICIWDYTRLEKSLCRSNHVVSYFYTTDASWSSRPWHIHIISYTPVFNEKCSISIVCSYGQNLTLHWLSM